MKVCFRFDVEEASDADLNRLAADAIKLMGTPSFNDYGSQVMLEIMAELAFRSTCRDAGWHMPHARRLRWDQG